MNKIVKNTLSLTLITVVLGVVLGLVHSVTAEPIARQEEQKKQEACADVFEDAQTFEAVELETSGLEEKFTSALADAGLEEEHIDELITRWTDLAIRWAMCLLLRQGKATAAIFSLRWVWPQTAPCRAFPF